jgi:hypothetical protein
MSILKECTCGSQEWPEAIHDGYGIFLFYACNHCRLAKLSDYREDIFEQYEAEEPIEPE